MATVKLIGSTASTGTTGFGTSFWLAKYTAEATGLLSEIKIRSSGSQTVKVAVYADNAGEPGARLAKQDTSQSLVDGWNTIALEASCSIVSGTSYWLAVATNASTLWYYTPSTARRFKVITYAGWSFPDPAGTGFTSDTGAVAEEQGFGVLVISPSGLSQPIAYGTPKLSLSIKPPGYQQVIAYGTPTVTVAGAAITIYPPGLQVVIAYGTPAILYPQSISPPGLAVPFAYGTPTLIPGTAFIYIPGLQQAIAYGTPKLILTIKPSGIAQAIAYGTPSLKYPQSISPPGLNVPIAYGTPSIASGVIIIYVPGHQQVIGYGTPTILKYVWHVILDGQYNIESPGTNRAYVIGRDVYGNPVYGEAHDSGESSLVGERLDFQQELSIPTEAQAGDVATAVLAKMRLTKARGVILIPYNCGQELWDVVQITDAGANQSAVKFRVVGLRFEYHPRQARYQHKLILGAP